MSQDLYSVEQVADRLGLQVRTVRAYVREGRLKAVRIGKQYRIAREDLEALTGRPAASFEPAPVRRTRHVEVSSTVEIDAISQEAAIRLTNALLATARNCRVETIYNEVGAHMKIILVGDLDTNAGMFRLIHVLLES